MREFALEGIRLDERHIGVRFGVRVLCHRVEADDVARHGLKVFQGKCGRAVGLLHALLLEQTDGLFRPAIHRIMQRHFRDAELIIRFYAHGDFLDGARAIIVARTRDKYVRRFGFACFDEEIIGQAHGLSLVERGDVIHAVLLHVHRALVHISFTAGQLNLLFVIEHQDAITQGLVGDDVQIGVRALYGAQVATAFLGHILNVRPGRIAVRNAHVFHAGKIEHANVEVLRMEGSRFHVIFNAFRQPGKNKLKARASRLRAHGHLVPFGGAVVASVEADVLRLQADELRRNH